MNILWSYMYCSKYSQLLLYNIAITVHYWHTNQAINSCSLHKGISHNISHMHTHTWSFGSCPMYCNSRVLGCLIQNHQQVGSSTKVTHTHARTHTPLHPPCNTIVYAITVDWLSKWPAIIVDTQPHIICNNLSTLITTVNKMHGQNRNNN